MDIILLQYLSPVTVAFLYDLLLALAIGYAIGAEREWRGKDAGISTHMFVVCGAMLFTYLSMTVDPASKSRIAAQIVTGIGFLGAGLIIKDGGSVKNLTTAASLWFAAGIGMALGFGYTGIAVIAGVASMLIPRVRHIKNTIKEVKQKIADDDMPDQSALLASDD